MGVWPGVARGSYVLFDFIIHLSLIRLLSWLELPCFPSSLFRDTMLRYNILQNAANIHIGV